VHAALFCSPSIVSQLFATVWQFAVNVSGAIHKTCAAALDTSEAARVTPNTQDGEARCRASPQHVADRTARRKRRSASCGPFECAPYCGALRKEPSLTSGSTSIVKPTVRSGLVGDMTFTAIIRMNEKTPG
jgi:hypothetical protein